MNKEFCIMMPSEFYSTERKPGLERHECLFGKNRKKSIEDGLVVFKCFYGSSKMNTKEMSELLDIIVGWASELGISTEEDFY